MTRHVGRGLYRTLEELDIGVPENLRQLIEQQLARVNPDERKNLRGGECGRSRVLCRSSGGGHRAIDGSGRNTL